ncbi:MAG: hypothetical protein PHR16_11825 [Methylovulum sp.]|nr:hypothetical protein [Methylovulum sp.]
MEPRIAVLMHHYANQWHATAHGDKRPLLEDAMRVLGVSDKTFYRWLKQMRPQPRKRRTDAGGTALPIEEAGVISAYLMEGYRLNNKRKAIALETAVTALRADGKIIAGQVDPSTGEIRDLSMSAIHRALYQYNLHPRQLRVAEPSTKLATEHPNQLWQIDGSVCVLYYLPDGSHVIEELDEGKHYKNKPQNLKAIEERRVIRYVLTDHTTNVTRFKYYPHAESAEHSVDFFCWAMAPKANPADPFHGRPTKLYVDPGATAGGLVQRLCVRMGIELVVHKARNAKATGSVENGQWRVESLFEQGLRFQRQHINSFDALNALAEVWQLHYNATTKVKRHGMARFEAWMHITTAQLVVTREATILKDLATSEPVDRTVSSNLTVSFDGKIWSVRAVPGVMVKAKVLVCWHPYRDCAMAVTLDAEGRETHIELADVTGMVDPAQGLWGFQTNANKVGEYHAMPDTVGEQNRKELALMASGSKTHDEDKKKRRKTQQYMPFDGEVNPFKAAETTELPSYINKRGTVLDMPTPRVEAIPLTVVHAAQILMARLAEAGIDWTVEHMKTLRGRFPGGVPEVALDGLVDEFVAWTARPKLAVVK